MAQSNKYSNNDKDVSKGQKKRRFEGTPRVKQIKN